MSKFHKGEIAIYVKPGSPYYGMEVEILSTGRNIVIQSISTGIISKGFGYEITDPAPEFGMPGQMASLEKYLRKKKPPEYDGYKTTAWSKCDWQPKETQHEIKIDTADITILKHSIC